MPFAVTWMDLEIIILSEVKTEKDKYMINVENPPAMQETQVQSIGQEYPLEKGIATHSSIVVWRTSWKEEPGRLQSMGSQKVEHESD